MGRSRNRVPMIFPDLPEERVASLVSGGNEEVEAAARRHAGWEGKAVKVLVALSILWAMWAFGWAGGLAGLSGIAIGTAIFLLGQASLRRQLKAARAYDALEAGNRFLSAALVRSLRLALLYLSFVVWEGCLAALTAFQRLLVSLSGLIHVGLAARLLPIPFCPR